jgi:enterochelin esterase-like enzyme
MPLQNDREHAKTPGAVLISGRRNSKGIDADQWHACTREGSCDRLAGMEPRHALYLVRAMIGLALTVPVVASVLAHGQENASLKSNEVHPDGSITFRYQDSGAGGVLVNLEGTAEPLAMNKDSKGVWSVVTPPLVPEIYGYGFEVDGRAQFDPNNLVIKPNLTVPVNLVTVPGSPPRLWEPRNVLHGVLHRHFYTSKVVTGLVDGQSEYYVYTPPTYDPKKAQPYPVLYLLHGWSDTAAGWTAVGQANFIFDNLIAEGKVKPMVVVMPLGYGDMKFVNSGHGVWDDDAMVDHNVALFTQALLTEVLPRVESNYHVSTDRNDRAIAGLSMGGLESLTIGLTHPGQFGWVGGFSSAAEYFRMDERFASLSGTSTALHLLWIVCGTEDDHIASNRKLIAWLKAKQVPVTASEAPGMHTWMVWRDNLARFAPLLFQDK